MEGMGVNHVHIKLYPMHGIDTHFKEMWSKEERYFEEYPGYISTVLGPKADSNVLAEIQKKILKK